MIFEGWHLHHLARRAKTFGIDKTLIEALENAGWMITHDENPSEDPLLQEALRRLGAIKDFDKTCDDPKCPICAEVVNEYTSTTERQDPWRLNVELYKWQKEAKRIWWDNNCKGIIKVVTGAGKTLFALSIISDLYGSEAYTDGGLAVFVVTPTTVLLDQWLFALMDKLNVPREDIGIFYGKKKEYPKDKKVLIYVVNSARDHIKEHYETYFKGKDIFLIADECHRYGSKENSKIFDVPFSYTLGLSATPERFGDTGFEEKLVPNLGDVIYTYTYNDALHDGVIPPYKLIRVRVRLTQREYEQYREISEKINRLSQKLFLEYPILTNTGDSEFFAKLKSIYAKTKDRTIISYISFLNQRKGLIHLSESKTNALKWLIENEDIKDKKILIFHERIDIADEIYTFLIKNGFKAGRYHTKLSVDERVKNITDYKQGTINILVSCRALDEGFDVPESEVGIIVAGTSSMRQWIQRMGRILRRTPGKEYSKIYVVFADAVERDVFTENELKDFEKDALSEEFINLTYL